MADYTKNAEIVNNPSDDDMMLMGDFGPGNARMLTESEMDTRDEISAKMEAGIPLTPDERGLVPGPENMYFDERVGRNVPVGTPNQQIMDEARRMGRDPFPAAEGLSSVEGPRTSRGMAPDQFPSPEGLSSVGRVEPMSGRISERSVDELIGARPAGPALKPLGPSEPKDVPDPRYAGIRATRKGHEAIMGGYDDVNRMNEKYGETARREGRGYTAEELRSIRSRIEELGRMSRAPRSAEKPDTVPPTRAERIQELRESIQESMQRLEELRRQQEARALESMREGNERFLQEERRRQLEELRRQQQILLGMDLNQLTDEELRMQRMITGNRGR